MFPCIMYLCQGYFLWLRENLPSRENSRKSPLPPPDQEQNPSTHYGCIDENSGGTKKKPQKNWGKYQEVAPQIKKKVEKKSKV